MPDYDVSAVALTSPPAIAPQTTYRPAISVRNNGLFPAVATGTLQAYFAGQRVFYSEVLSPSIGPGETGEAAAADEWTPTNEGDHIFFGEVTTHLDQDTRNNQLAPTTVHVGPPPPPPAPATLDDVVEALAPLSTEETLEAAVEAIPPTPATEPTLEEVRDKLPANPATEPGLLAIIEQLQLLGMESTAQAILSQLQTGTGPTSAPNDYAAQGKTPVGTSEAVALTALDPTRAVLIQADPANTGNLLVGQDFLQPTGDGALAVLLPGDSISVELDISAAALHVIATAPDQNFYWGYTLH